MVTLAPGLIGVIASLHLETRLLELDELHRERPGLPTAMAWAEAGQRIDDQLHEIAELQWLIDERSAETWRTRP